MVIEAERYLPGRVMPLREASVALDLDVAATVQ
jgi:hypothetical protein